VTPRPTTAVFTRLTGAPGITPTIRVVPAQRRNSPHTFPPRNRPDSARLPAFRATRSRGVARRGGG
jgi:hypothetical protein